MVEAAYVYMNPGLVGEWKVVDACGVLFDYTALTKSRYTLLLQNRHQEE